MLFSEAVRSGDPMINHTSMIEAMSSEVKGIFEKGTCKVVLKEEVFPDGNVLSGRFVMTIKSTENDELELKARFVVGGYRDKIKNLVIHSSQTSQTSSIN